MSDRRPEEITDDGVLGGRLKLLQPRRGHRFGHDAILLAAATAASGGEHAVDLGAGVGAAGLALACRVPGLAVTLVERDAELSRLAAENIARNDLADRARAVALDINSSAPEFAAAGLPAETADHVLMNPPFNDPARQQASPEARRRAAHMPGTDLAAWVGAATMLLRNSGTVTLIWRAEGLGDVLAALGSGYGDVAVRAVHGRDGEPAIRILVRGVKGSRASFALLPPLMLNDAQGRPTEAAEAVLRGGAALPF